MTNPTPTGEAIEEAYRKIHDEGCECGSCDNRETLTTLFLAGRQSMAEEIEGSLPAEKVKQKSDSDEYSYGWENGFADGSNEFRAQVLEIIAKKKGT